MKPLISVITLTYKNYDRLYDTIQSVIDQDYPNIEYIISDDGSGDFPEDEVRYYINKNTKDKAFNYKIIVNKSNNGTVKNFNNAIKESNGKYIFPLSCNDFFVNTHIVSEIENIFNNTDAKMVITSRIKYKGDKLKCFVPHLHDRKKIYELDTNYNQYRALLLTEHFGMFIGCNMYYDKQTLSKYGLFDENYRLLEDLPILEKLMWKEKVVLEPRLVSIFYDGDTGVTLKKHKTHSQLEIDVNKFNEHGKTIHLDEMDNKTKKHVFFGIERARTRNWIQMIFVCIKYIPRLISFFVYSFKRFIFSFEDNKMLNEYLGEYNRFCHNKDY